MRVGRLVYWWLRARDLIKIEHALTIIGLTLAGLIHDSPEGYVGDDLGPIKTPDRSALEAGILVAIAEHLVGTENAPAIVAFVNEHPAVEWADHVSLHQEALLYQPGAQDRVLPNPIGLPPEQVSAAIEARIEIAGTLHLFHPREGEDWQAVVREVAEQYVILAAHGPATDPTISAQFMNRLEQLLR
jgi:hypothetical protein